MWWILIILAILFIVVLVLVSKKSLKMGDYVVITGKVKSGKSTLSLSLAHERYKTVHFKWKLCELLYKPIYYFAKGLNRNYKHKEEPLFYSNIPVAFPHVRLTKDLILRNKRFNYKSIIYIDEASLLIDSQSIRDKELNLETLLWNKLIAHETRGGAVYMNSQNIEDLHYNIKRCASSYLYVNKCIKKIPFILVFQARELINTNSISGATNNFNEDIEDTMKWCWCWKKIWKKFDCYCYSSMTYDLPIENKVILYDKKNKNFKTCDIITFNKDLQDKLEKGGD